MSDLSIERIGEVVIEALERTAFVLADAVDQDEAEECGSLTNYSRIAFTGELNGEIHLAATDGFLCELAASLLGTDIDEVDLTNHGRDALCELTNIVGGSIILELGGDEKPYEYGLPEVVDGSVFASSTASDHLCYLRSEDDALVVSWVPKDASARQAA